MHVPRDDLFHEERTPLAVAAHALYPKTVHLLLKHGARADIGHPLHCLGMVASAGHGVTKGMEYFYMAQQLIQHGAVVNISVTSGTNTVDFLLCDGGIIDTSEQEKQMNRKFLYLHIRENALLWLGQEHAEISTSYDSGSLSDPTLLLQYSNLDMSMYLYELGFNLKLIEVLRAAGDANSEYLPTRIKSLLKEIEDTKLWNLQSSCRRCIRRVLGSSLSSKIPKLGLPPVLQNFMYIVEI